MLQFQMKMATHAGTCRKHSGMYGYRPGDRISFVYFMVPPTRFPAASPPNMPRMLDLFAYQAIGR